MRKYKTIDGYYVYKIVKEKSSYFLANRENYKESIDKLKDNLEDIKFDSIIIIFGFDTGEYLEELISLTCERNKIVIIEPNEEIYNEYKVITDDKVAILLFDEDKIKGQLGSFITPLNFNNLYVHSFGNYKEVYKNEYDKLISSLDFEYFSKSSVIVIANRFREVFIKNVVWNLNILEEATSVNNYENIQKNVPAFIISAGPSLEKNLRDMVKYKESVEKSIVIAGSRTLKAVLESGIKPDLLVTVDPVDDNFEMVKDYLDCGVPIVFYEYSNRKILREYLGDKIYLANLLPIVIEELSTLKGTYLGGSVAHTCVDLARQLGCNTIILVGQDLAFTDEKHHSDSATFNIDNTIKYKTNIVLEDVNGKEVKSNTTLKQFKETLERYIIKDVKENLVKYINVSYGAKIMGAEHIELDKVFKLDIFNCDKKSFQVTKDIEINSEEVIKNILDFINYYIEKSKDCIEDCIDLMKCPESKSLIGIDEDDQDLEKFIYLIEVINSFDISQEKIFLSGYFNKFDFEVKQEKFSMLAKEYEVLTGNLRYQSICFKYYFEELKKMLEEVKMLIEDSVTEYKEYHKIN